MNDAGQVLAPARTFRLLWWPAVAAVLLLTQAALSITVRQSGTLTAYALITYFLVLLLAAGTATLNAVHNKEAIRLFWSFLALAFGAWSLGICGWIYYMLVLGRDRPAYLGPAIALTLHIVFMIAAVVSRPHLKLSPQRGSRTTLNFLLLVFFWVFAYAFLWVRYSYTEWNVAFFVRGQALYLAENFLLLVVLGVSIVRAQPPWRSIYRHLFGASALYILSSSIGNYLIFSRGVYFGLKDIPFTAVACWFVWVALLGQKLAPQLTQSVQPETRGTTKYAPLLAMVSMLSALAVPTIGVWELLRPDEPYRTRVIRLLIVLLSVVLLAVFALAKEYLANRELSSDVVLANERLRSAMESGKAVGWEWDRKTGRDSWFGDLKTMFGIESETYFGRPEDFHRYVHPEDRKLVSDALADARINHRPYAAEFRVVWPEGTQRWVAARGRFYYSRKGEPERMLGMAVDMTDHKWAEDAVRQSEARYRRIVETTSEGIWLLDSKFQTSFVNRQMAGMLGYEPAEMLGRSVFDFYFPEDVDRKRQILARRQDRLSEHFDDRLRRRDGAALWVRMAAIPICTDNGDFDGAMAIVSDITDRKRVEEALRQSQDRLAGIAASAMDAIIAIDDAQQIVLFNSSAEKMFGCPAQDAMGSPIERFIPQRFRAGHGAHIRRFGETGVTNRAMGALNALWALRSNGQEFPIEASISHVEDGGKKLFTVIIRDITDRKLAEEALRESEARFRLVADTAPALIWMSGTDKLCTFFNKGWLDFTGRSLESELGNGWAEGVHPEDLQRCLETYTRAFDAHEKFTMEYRLRRYDGEYRWVLDIGVPRFNEDGLFAGYIGSGVDVTDRRRAEEALSTVNSRLIEAQERERARIARELHDDIGQRLALLTVELGRLEQSSPDLPPEVSSRVGALQEQVSGVASDVQSLSHELHSSKLELLGIMRAMRGFCREFSEKRNVEVVFAHDDIRCEVPQEIALCLFRVLQEALQNAAKHSGVRHFHVDLRETSDKIQLIVRDSGSGFDYQEALKTRGLGLTSMAERVKLVRGRLSIDSQPQRGTIVRVSVPLSSGSYSMRAAG
jgi:PAS domain S-box-containing protein